MVKECKFCKKVFETDMKKMIYCSHKCATDAHKEKIREKKEQIKKICAVCGAPFETNRPHKMTCSYECAEIRYRGKRAEYGRKKKFENKNKKEKSTPTKKLVDDAVVARKLGMTYGQYKAMQYMNINGDKDK